LIIIIFDYFLGYNGIPNIITSFEWNNWIFPIYYVIGIVLSVFLIKIKWIISVTEQTKFEKNGSSKNEYEIGGNTSNTTSVKKIIVNVLILIRLLIFNIFNEVFVLIVFWSFYIFLLSIFPFINYPLNYDFTPFFTAMGMIGIIAGLFQVYVNTNEEKVMFKVKQHLKNYLITYIQHNATKEDFIEYFSNVDYGNKEKQKNNIISMLKKTPPVYKRHNRPTKDNISVLDTMCDEYFTNKFNHFTEVMRKEDGLIKLKGELLSSIVFFDEIEPDLYNLDDILNNTNTICIDDYNTIFSKHHKKFVNQCGLALIEKVSMLN
jgi:hypothetical protein